MGFVVFLVIVYIFKARLNSIFYTFWLLSSLFGTWPKCLIGSCELPIDIYSFFDDVINLSRLDPFWVWVWDSNRFFFIFDSLFTFVPSFMVVQCLHNCYRFSLHYEQNFWFYLFFTRTSFLSSPSLRYVVYGVVWYLFRLFFEKTLFFGANLHKKNFFQ